MEKDEITSLVANSTETEKAPHQTLEVNFPGRQTMETMSLKDRAAAMEHFEKLKLENQFFRIHSREEMEIDEVREKIKDPNTNVYLLIHGWTGTSEIFDSVHKSDGKTIVEEILETDPNAVIICPDGNGFGKTNFKDMRLGMLSSHCKPEDYAEQMEVLITDVLGMNEEDKDRLYVMGHSLGGAATMIMAGKGFARPENCVAVCPAALPRLSEREHTAFDPSAFEKVRTTYDRLGKLVEVGDITKNQIGGPLANKEDVRRHAGEALGVITDKVVGVTFEHALSAPLMGLDHPGSNTPEQMRSIINELRPIHGKQAEKVAITSASMRALARGVHIGPEMFNGDMQKWNEYMARMDSVDVVAGEKDILAPVHQFKNLVSEKAHEAAATSENSGDLDIVEGAGHYAALYESGDKDPTVRLVAKVASNKRITTLISESV